MRRTTIKYCNQSYHHSPRIGATHADSEVTKYSKGDRLGVSHSLVTASVLILDQHLKRLQVLVQSLGVLGQDVGASALEIKPPSVKALVVGVPRALACCMGCRVAVPDAALQGTVLRLLTGDWFALWHNVRTQHQITVKETKTAHSNRDGAGV